MNKNRRTSCVAAAAMLAFTWVAAVKPTSPAFGADRSRGGAAAAVGPYFRLVPVPPQGANAAPYPEGTIIDSAAGTISFAGTGPQRVWLEARFGGWASGGTLKVYQFSTVDLSATTGGLLRSADEACTPGAQGDAFCLLQYGDGPSSASGCSPNLNDCEEAFTQFVGGNYRPDFLNLGIFACNTVSESLFCGSADIGAGCASDNADERYAATLVVETTAAVTGLTTITVDLLSAQTFFQLCDDSFPTLKLSGAEIEFRAGQCDSNADCVDQDPCTTDTCGAGMTCENTPIPNCPSVGTAFTYQGLLENPPGTPVTDICAFEFKLCDDPGDPNDPLAPCAPGMISDHLHIEVSDGVFTVPNVDFGPGALTGERRWLELSVQCFTRDDTLTVMLPRVEITPAPYALALPGFRTGQTGGSPNVLGGFVGNSVGQGVEGATISGGGASNPIDGRCAGDPAVLCEMDPDCDVAQVPPPCLPDASVGRCDDDATLCDSTQECLTGLCILPPSPNQALADYVSIGGGYGNVAGGALSPGGVATGFKGEGSSVGGGLSNTASGKESTISGGTGNLASGYLATVSGGGGNKASASYATVPGGRGNTAGGQYSFAAGRQAKVRAIDHSTFVWADTFSLLIGDFSDDFESTRPNQFLIRAHGGVGVGTNAPQQQLSVSRGLNIDQDNSSDGTLSTGRRPALTFGSASGEGIACKRTPGGNQFGLDFFTGFASRMTITNGGNVGIGKPDPQAKLDVDGTARVKVIEIMGADLAEKFPVSEEVKPGMVVSIDPEHPGQLRLSREAYDRRVAGVVSGANGLSVGAVLGNLPGNEGAPPIALSGRVWVYCETSSSPIQPGDLLTTSDTPGHAMKVADHAAAHGAIIGKAMTHLPTGEKGLVLVLVSLQ